MNENLKFTLLTQKTASSKNGHRGVYQRNAGLAWVKEHQVNSSAIVYSVGDKSKKYPKKYSDKCDKSDVSISLEGFDSKLSKGFFFVFF